MVLHNIFIAGLATCMVHQIIAEPKPSFCNPLGCSSPCLPSLPFPYPPTCPSVPPGITPLPSLSLPYQPSCELPTCPPSAPNLPILPSLSIPSQQSCQSCSPPCPPTLPYLPPLPSFPLLSCQRRCKSFCSPSYIPPFLPPFPSLPLSCVTPYQSLYSPSCSSSYFPSYPQSCSYSSIPELTPIPFQNKRCAQQQSVTIPNIILALLPPTAKSCGCEKSCSFGSSCASPYYGSFSSQLPYGCGAQQSFVPVSVPQSYSIPDCNNCCC